MIRTLLLVAVLLTLLFPVFASAANCPPARHSSKKAREARAKAKLERIKPLINAGKYKTARRRLEKLIRDYPRTVAALQAHIILGTLED
jgi:hypothetical protein